MTCDYTYFYKFKTHIYVDYVIAFQQNLCAMELKIA